MTTLSGNAGPYVKPLGGVLRRVFPGSGLIDVGDLKPKKKKKKKVVGGSEDQLFFNHAESILHVGSLFTEEAANDVDFDGFWITVNGSPMFIGAKALLMKPKKPKNFKLVKVKKTKKDGTVYYEEKEPGAWVERKEKYKFAKTASMARNFDQMGKTLERESDSEELDQKKAAATVLLLIHATGMRIGGAHGGPGKSKRRRVEGGAKSDEEVDTFGASTLQKRHVKVEGDTVHINYIGKAGVEHKKSVRNKVLAKSVKAFLGGKDSSNEEAPLFKFKGSGDKPVSREQCSKRLKKFNEHYNPKDMRTVKANQIASDILIGMNQKTAKAKMSAREKAKAAKALVAEIGDKVASALGNTRNVAIASYVNPALVMDALQKAGLA